MHLCFVSEECPPETGWGGIGTYTYAAATGLAALGHGVDVVTRTWGDQRIDQLDGVRFHRTRVADWTWRRGTSTLNERLPETRRMFDWARAAAKVVTRLHADDPFDVVECAEYHAEAVLVAARHPRLPVVVRLHSPAYLCRVMNGTSPAATAVDRWISETAERLLYEAARLITAPSHEIADRVAQDWRRRDIRVVPNPVDTTASEAPGARDPHLVVFAGRLEHRKGVETLVDALPQVLESAPDVQVRLVGGDHPSGPDGVMMAEYLRTRLAELHIPDGVVEFAGSRQHDEMATEYRAAGICVVPSLWENFPYSCLEAMCGGCAVIASATGGIPEIVRDGRDGLLVPPGEPHALACAMVTLLRSPEQARTLGEAARRSVEQRFSRDVVCARLEALYREVARR